MKLAKGIWALGAAMTLVLAAAPPVQADELAVESAEYFGHIYYSAITGNSNWESTGGTTALVGDVYNNTNPATPIFGFGLTDLAAVMGDRVTTTGMGILSEVDFTVYNAGSSAGNLLTGQFGIALLDGPTSTVLGSFGTSVNFGTGLPPGFFATITVTGLTGLNINVNTTDVQIFQQAIAVTGPATRIGIASLDPPTIGSSANTMYINSASVGPPGYYNLGNPPLNANPGYRINLSVAVPTAPTTWGKMKSLYH